MSEHRFHLQKYTAGKNNKLCCPQCGKCKRFDKYIDRENKIAFPNYVGKCDREIKCDYHYTPKDFFKDNDMKPNDFNNGIPKLRPNKSYPC